MIYLETGSTDPAYNLAFEEYCLSHAEDEDILILWQNDRTVVIGLNQNAFEEIDPEIVKEYDIRVVRRMTGGGAVYHDLGNLNYSLITKVGKLDEVSVNPFMKIVCNALDSFGLNAEFSGRNDITIDGKKISGTAQRVAHGHILHHGTLLFQSDPEIMGKVLTPSQLKFDSKGTKSVKSRVGNIADWLGEKVTLMDFWAGIRDAVLGEEPVIFHPDETALAEIRFNADTKYRSWDWTYGNSPESTVSGKEKFPGGILEFRANVENGRIKDIHFYGDYMARAEDRSLREGLIGICFTEEEVGKVLDSADLVSIFGSITKQEILGLMF